MARQQGDSDHLSAVAKDRFRPDNLAPFIIGSFY